MTLDRRRIPPHIAPVGSRRVAPPGCKQRFGMLGCDTTGWQDLAEVTDTVVDEVNHDGGFEKFVRKLWKQHANQLPSFMPVRSRHRTQIGNNGSHWNDLVVITECADHAPSWDPQRPTGARVRPTCRLYTVIGFDWELTP